MEMKNMSHYQLISPALLSHLLDKVRAGPALHKLQLWQRSCASDIYGCVTTYTPNSAALTLHIFLISHNVWGSGIQVQLNYMLSTQRPSRIWSQDVFWSCSHPRPCPRLECLLPGKFSHITGIHHVDICRAIPRLSRYNVWFLEEWVDAGGISFIA